MKELKGTIKAVDLEDHNGYEKKIVTLAMGLKERAFIEFRGYLSKAVTNSMIGEKVLIKLNFNGKTSRMGRNYNNLIGKSIKTL